jgi:site-specific recombinase
MSSLTTATLAKKPTQLDALLALGPAASRERATWVYTALRNILDVPLASRTDRLLHLAAEIDAHPRSQEIRDILHDFWSHHSYIRVIAEAGLPDEVFFVRELFARTLRHLTPVDEVQGDLYVLLDSLNLREDDAQWMASLPDSVMDWWADIFRPSPSSILVSCKLLAMRATSVALSRDFLALADDDDVADSSFFTLPPLVEHVVRNPDDFPQWEARRDACEARLREGTDLLEQTGSSASLVFRMRLLRSLLWRIQQVLNLQRNSSDSRKFAVTIVHGFASQRKLVSVVSASTRRLARSVVEKTGRVGNHYIAKNSAQWKTMGWGAILAGVITCFTAFFKYSISSHIQAPLIVALGHSLNYVISFLLMQAGGFLLASKMPAATASTLVDAMEDPQIDHLASLQAISQTQTLVTMGNVFGAVLSSIAVDRIWNAVAGHPFLTLEQAEHGVNMLFPLSSLTIPFAIVTGIFLWLSSLATGWTANYLALTRMETAIVNSLRIRRRLGPARANALAHWVKHHAAGSIGYVVLGFLLGSVPIIVSLFGIPLEVRHVTLASAGLGYTLDALWLERGLTGTDLLYSFAGIFLVGVLNIVTSFALSFLLAVRARDIGEAKARLFLKEVLQKLSSHPLTFLLPHFEESPKLT